MSRDHTKTREQLIAELAEARKRIEELESRDSHSGQSTSPEHVIGPNALDALPTPIFFKGTNGRYTACNKAFEAFLGLSRQEIIGKSVHDITPRGLAGVYEAMDARLYRDGGVQHYESPVRSSGGEVRHVSFQKALYRDDSGDVAGMAGVIIDITQRKMNEKAVALAEQRLRLSQEAGGVGSFENDLVRGTCYWSDQYFRILGFEPGQVTPSEEQFLQCIEEDERENVRQEFLRAGNEDDTFSMQVPVTTTGELRWIEISGRVERDSQGAATRLIGTTKDVTKRRKALDTLLDSEAFYRAIFVDNQALKLLIHPETGHILDANPAAARFYGYSLERLKRLRIFDLNTLSKKEVKEAMSNACQGATRLLHFKHRLADGEVRDMDVFSGPVSIQGRTLLYSILFDVTERQQAREARRFIEERLEAVLTGSGLGMWDWDLESGRVHRDERWARMLGYEIQDIQFTVEQWLELIHPEDRDQAMQSIQAHCRGESPRHDLVYRMLAKDGQVKWIHDQAMVVQRDETGRPLRMSGTHADVTDRKIMENNFLESQKLFRKTFETENVGMAISRKSDGCYIETNPGFCRITGYPAHELVGRTSRELGFFDNGSRQELLGRLSDTGTLHNEEMTFRTRDGDTRGILFSISPIAYQGEECLLATMVDITERREAEKAVQASEKKYRLLAENSEDIIWTSDLDLNYTFVSPSVERILGYTVEESLAVKASDHLPLEALETARAEVKHRLDMEKDRDPSQPEEPRLLELPQIHKEGHIVWTEVVSRPVRDSAGAIVGLQGTTRDVTDRKKAQDELKVVQNRLRAMFDHLGSGVAVYRAVDQGADFEFLDFNPAAERITRVPKEQVLGRRLLECFPNMRDTALPATLKRVWLSGDPVHMEPFHYEDSTREGWRENRIYRLPEGEVVAIFEDVTRRMESERQLVQARERAELASKSKSEFLASMSHEIRTPMSGMLGMLELMKRAGLKGEVAEYVNSAHDSGQNLLMVINDILDFSKIESGKVELQTGPFSVRDLLESVIRTFLPLVDTERLDLGYHVHAHVPRTVKADESRLRQILNNLVGNAVKFTDQGEVKVEVRSRKAPEHEGLYLQFSIQDTGSGISPDKIPYLFEPFTQAEGSYRRRFQGTGLGLSIVKRLVKLMHGDIRIKSRENEGTTIHVDILVEEPDIQEQTLEQPDQAPVNRRPLSILLAEDERLNIMAMTRLLETEGHEVTTATTGKEVLSLMHDKDFDLVLMDIQMPEMDGLETTRAIRGMSVPRHKASIPIIALTAYAMAGDREQFMAQGMDGYLAKPLDLEAFYKVVDELEPGL